MALVADMVIIPIICTITLIKAPIDRSTALIQFAEISYSPKKYLRKLWDSFIFINN